MSRAPRSEWCRAPCVPPLPTSRLPPSPRSRRAGPPRSSATADSAGVAYSTHSEAAKQLTVQPATIASLQLPAGNYALGAKEQVDTFSNADIIDCDLVAGTDKDSSFVQGGAGHQSQIVTNSLVHTFTTPGTATLTCNTFGIGSISQVRVTAVTVGSIVSQPGP